MFRSIMGTQQLTPDGNTSCVQADDQLKDQQRHFEEQLEDKQNLLTQAN